MSESVKAWLVVWSGITAVFSALAAFCYFLSGWFGVAVFVGIYLGALLLLAVQHFAMWVQSKINKATGSDYRYSGGWYRGGW